MLSLVTLIVILVIICLASGFAAGVQDEKKFFSDGNMIHFWNREGRNKHD